MSDARARWERFRHLLVDLPEIPLRLDPSAMSFEDADLEALAPALDRAFDEMAALERGAVANADEGRMVGHYWLRAPELAPTPELRAEIERTTERVISLAADVHAGRLAPPGGGRFDELLVVGIGGSALGPQLASSALRGAAAPMRARFLDNTDPDGIDRVLAELGDALARTLVVVISKSGGTKETRNGMLEVRAAYARRGLRFGAHAIAVTGEGSELARFAAAERFLAVLPMWDWVGGRTSETSAVGLLPAALEGADVRALLEGARAMDAATRVRDVRANPAALLAALWHLAGAGRGEKDMVVLPYKDRLELFGKYLQQLVMESIGKGLDREGRVVEQGLVVYGNKGSTDQHAYVQQLREGLSRFFVTFVEVERDRDGTSIEVEPGVTSGDYLFGFLRGTREALRENGRGSLTITVRDTGARALGALIALYERAVGLYASLVGVNAYHQPGVEAGKRAAGVVVALQARVVSALAAAKGTYATADAIAARAGTDDVETVFAILEHLAANPGRGVVRRRGATPCEATYAAG